MSDYVNKLIKITEIEDHEDGSATMQLDLDPETYAAIFNVGFIYLIQKGIDNDTDIRRGEYDNDQGWQATP